VRALGRQAEHDPARVEVEALAQLALGERLRPAHGAEPERHDVDSRGRQTEQLDQVIARARRVGDHAIGAARGRRHEHAHPLLAQPSVRFGKARIDQVVHGDDAPKATPHRRGAREAVHEVDFRAHGERRQQRLLAEHPLHAVARAHRHGDERQQLTQLVYTRGAVARLAGRGLAVDERREAHPVGCGGEQRRDQLARSNLHPAGLARNEEDQVQPDVTRNSAQAVDANHIVRR
jgi:hypothetical protein